MAWNRILEFNALVKLHIYKYIYKYTYKKWIKYESEKIREKYIYIYKYNYKSHTRCIPLVLIIRV